MTASLTKTHNNVAENVAARGTSAENATVASTSKNIEHFPSMDSTAAIAEDTGDKSHSPPAGKGKRKAIDPAAGLSKRRSRAGGVSGFGNEDVEMKTTFSSKLCSNTHTLLSMPSTPCFTIPFAHSMSATICHAFSDSESFSYHIPTSTTCFKFVTHSSFRKTFCL